MDTPEKISSVTIVKGVYATRNLHPPEQKGVMPVFTHNPTSSSAYEPISSFIFTDHITLINPDGSSTILVQISGDKTYHRLTAAAMNRTQDFRSWLYHVRQDLEWRGSQKLFNDLMGDLTQQTKSFWAKPTPLPTANYSDEPSSRMSKETVEKARTALHEMSLSQKVLSDQLTPHLESAQTKTVESELTEAEKCAILFFGGIQREIGTSGKISFSPAGIKRIHDTWVIYQGI